MIGKTLGRYKILEQLGKGGMGEVYLADDTTLNRRVALKLLPEVFAGDPERMARFEREAKLLASLNHPNIAGIYGLEQAEGKRFLVLELVEGETLAQRVGKGALPLEEALGICRQIAEGLEAAHDKGVIHRDLKPANVMITEGDKVKILDFGLAKALADETQSVDSSQSPTLTEAMTRPGVILGTAAYMSPEQAKGKAVDKRADIWAFGCILFECLTGKRAFEVETITETLAAILKGEPDWNELPTTVPSNIRGLLGRCLQKEPRERLRDVGDGRLEMSKASVIAEDVPGLTSSGRMAGLRRHSLWIMALLATVVIALAVAFYFSRRALNPPRAQEIIATLPTNAGVTLNAHYSLPALSPDGTRVVFPAIDKQGIRSLWLRSLSDPEAVRLTGTDWASYPFWSPDGKYVGFFANDQLRTIEAAGGPARILCSNMFNVLGASWSPSGVIVLAANGTLLRTVAAEASGGACTPLNLEHAILPARPVFLNDGRRFLFFNQNTTKMGPIFVCDLDTGKSRELKLGANNPVFVAPNWLLYVERNVTIYASRFDPSSLRQIGNPVPLLDGVQSPSGFAAYTVTGDSLVALPNVGPSTPNMQWIDLRGNASKKFDVQADVWGGASLSPDNRRLAHSGWGLWFFDFDSGVSTRIPAETSPVSPEAIRYPKWSPHGDLLAYTSYVSTNTNNVVLRIFDITKGKHEEVLLQSVSNAIGAIDWFPNGKSLAAVIEGTMKQVRSEVVSVSVDDRKTQTIFSSSSAITDLRVSPGGQWLVYVSDETGRPEVFVRRIPGQAGAIQISQGGAKKPHWRADGKCVFYQRLDNSIMEVEVQTSPRLASFPPKVVVQAGQDTAMDLYAVSRDAQQFLVVVTPQPTSYTLMLNWASRIEKQSK